MTLRPAALCGGALVGGTILWAGFNRIHNISEPGDHAAFGSAYAGALILTGILGALAQRHAWLAGLKVVFAMLPVMLMESGAGPLLGIGIIFLPWLAIPACGVGALSHYFVQKVAR